MPENIAHIKGLTRNTNRMYKTLGGDDRWLTNAPDLWPRNQVELIRWLTDSSIVEDMEGS